MAVYKFTLTGHGPKINGATGAIVVAENATDALAIVQENNHWASDAEWAAATLVNLSTLGTAEGMRMIVNVGSIASCDVTGPAAATINTLCTLAAAAITTSGTLSGVSAASSVINLGTAAVAGALTITGSIVDSSGTHLTGFDPVVSNTGTAALARTVTFPTTAQSWPVTVPIAEAIAIPTS